MTQTKILRIFYLYLSPLAHAKKYHIPSNQSFLPVLPYTQFFRPYWTSIFFKMI